MDELMESGMSRELAAEKTAGLFKVSEDVVMKSYQQIKCKTSDLIWLLQKLASTKSVNDWLLSTPMYSTQLCIEASFLLVEPIELTRKLLNGDSMNLT